MPRPAIPHRDERISAFEHCLAGPEVSRLLVIWAVWLRDCAGAMEEAIELLTGVRRVEILTKTLGRAGKYEVERYSKIDGRREQKSVRAFRDGAEHRKALVRVASDELTEDDGDLALERRLNSCQFPVPDRADGERRAHLARC